MPNVTVESGSGKRSYKGNYIHITAIDVDKTGSIAVRSYDEPVGWEKGMGQFLVAVNALHIVADMQGNEKFKTAARGALDVINGLEHEPIKKKSKKEGVENA
jgi:hypothetical protein